MSNQTADVIAYNGKIATQNEQRSIVEAVAIRDGKFLATGNESRDAAKGLPMFIGFGRITRHSSTASESSEMRSRRVADHPGAIVANRSKFSRSEHTPG